MVRSPPDRPRDRPYRTFGTPDTSHLGAQEGVREAWDHGGTRSPRAAATCRSPQIPHTSSRSAYCADSHVAGSTSTEVQAHRPLFGHLICTCATVPPWSCHHPRSGPPITHPPMRRASPMCTSIGRRYRRGSIRRDGFF
jgi:hypothetical protein